MLRHVRRQDIRYVQVDLTSHLPPMPRTMILTPLDISCFDEENKKLTEENAKQIKEVLDNMKYSEEISSEDFLSKLQLI